MTEILANMVRRPRLWPPDSYVTRRVTWLELFFDLIFVAAVDQIGEPFLHAYSWEGLVRYGFLLVLIWSAWSGHTLFSTRFDTDDIVQRVLTLVQCFVAAVMAANSREQLDSRDAAGFGAAYAVIRVILVVQYLRVRGLPETRTLAGRHAVGYGIAACLWLASAGTEAPIRYVIWCAAFVVDFITPWLAGREGLRHPPNPAHFPERFGLFTIILMGEFVACVMRGIESQEYWSVPAAATAFGSMALGFGLWWAYFDGVRAAAHRHVRSRRDAARFFAWQYVHLPLALGIGATGVGLQLAIHSVGMKPLGAEELRILLAAFGLVAGSLGVLSWTRERRSATVE